MSFQDDVNNFQYRHPVTMEVLDFDSMSLDDLKDLNRLAKEQLSIASYLGGQDISKSTSEVLQTLKYLNLLSVKTEITILYRTQKADTQE